MDPMRRNRVDQRTMAETAISNAMAAVEAAGAHPLLTDAAVLLGLARDRVADFVDGVPRAERQTVDIVFDGPPGPECGRFVEVEASTGESIHVGDWVKRDDGYWVLRIPDPRSNI